MRSSAPRAGTLDASLTPSTCFIGIRMPKSNFTTPAQELTVEFARENISYDPLTGELHWLKPGVRRLMDRPVGSVHTSGYVRLRVLGKVQYAHRLAWLLSYGAWPQRDIDHINGVRSDNRLANLRDVSRTANCENQRCAPSSNRSTGVLGVCWHPGAKKFMASIGVSRKKLYLGLFPTAEEAHQAYLQAKRRLHPGCTL